MNIGERLKTIKKQFRFKHDEFAELLGVTSPTLSKYYKGENMPGLESIFKIIEHIPDLNINWLLYGKGEMLIGKSANNQINTYDKNNSIGQVTYDPEEAVYKVGTNNAKFEEKIRKLENEIKQLKALADAKDKIIDSLEGNIDTLNEMITMLKNSGK